MQGKCSFLNQPLLVFILTGSCLCHGCGPNHSTLVCELLSFILVKRVLLKELFIIAI